MPSENKSVQNGLPITAYDLSDAIKKGKYMLVERASYQPHILQYGTQAAAVTVPTLPTAVQDNVAAIYLPGAIGFQYIEMYSTTAQTLNPSRHATKGLEIGLDKVDNECVEYVPGGNHAANPLGYLAGTDPGIVMRVTLEITDTSGSDQLVFGLRKQENYVVPTSFLNTGDALYTDFFGIGFSGTAAANLVKTVWDLNNAGSTTAFSTTFAWADAGIHQLEIRAKARKIRHFINGVELGGTVRKDALGTAITAQPTLAPPLQTIDTGDFMIPFLFHRYDATTPGTVFLRRLEIAPLSELGLAPEDRVPA